MTTALHPAITALATEARAMHPGTRVVLAYGSALREATPENTLVDLYVLTEDFGGVSTSAIAQWGCRLVPPNVRYLEINMGSKTYRAKYAVLPLHQFASRCGQTTSNPYFWARFAQPTTLIWSSDDDATRQLGAAFTSANVTAFAHAKALAPNGSPDEQWSKLFAETYRTEFRPERAGRNTEIISANKEYFDEAARLNADVAPINANWPLLRFTGKCLTILRLIKASFTFQGGPDYLAWKIKRHSGVDIQLTDFQRKHPLLASLTLLPTLLRKGAVK
jgi:hypothetical protein